MHMFNNIIYYTVLTNMILGTSTCVHMYANKTLVKPKSGRGKNADEVKWGNVNR